MSVLASCRRRVCCGLLPDALLASPICSLRPAICCRWVKAQDDAELWTDGVEDYLRYAKELVSEFEDVLEAAPAAPNAAGAFAFGAAAPGAAACQPAPSSFLFGALPGTQAAGAAGAAPAAQPFTGFNFGQPAAAAGIFGAPSSGALNTLGGGGAATAAAAGGDDDDDDEAAEEEEEPSIELESSDAEILSKHRVKLMSQLEGSWKARGPGTLSIRRPIAASEAGTRAPYLVFTTDTGRVLLSAPLVKGLKPVVQAKQPASLLMVLVNMASGAEEKGMHAFRCEGADAAQALLAQVNSHV